MLGGCAGWGERCWGCSPSSHLDLGPPWELHLGAPCSHGILMGGSGHPDMGEAGGTTLPSGAAFLVKVAAA